MTADFRLGTGIVRPQRRIIERGDESFHVRPKAMAVFECLLAAGGEPVSRRELFDTVWPGSEVTDDAPHILGHGSSGYPRIHASVYPGAIAAFMRALEIGPGRFHTPPAKSTRQTRNLGGFKSPLFAPTGISGIGNT